MSLFLRVQLIHHLRKLKDFGPSNSCFTYAHHIESSINVFDLMCCNSLKLNEMFIRSQRAEDLPVAVYKMMQVFFSMKGLLRLSPGDNSGSGVC
jgi:hypothetical protein